MSKFRLASKPDPSRQEVSFEEVARVWRSADAGKGPASTEGILFRFRPFVTGWRREPLLLSTLNNLYVIGGREEWRERTGGSFLVKDARPSSAGEPARVPDSVLAVLVAVEQDDRAVLIDGNSRAIALLERARTNGDILDTASIYIGTLDKNFALAAAAVSPIWSPLFRPPGENT